MGIGIPNSDLHKIDCFTKYESNLNYFKLKKL